MPDDEMKETDGSYPPPTGTYPPPAGGGGQVPPPLPAAVGCLAGVFILPFIVLFGIPAELIWHASVKFDEMKRKRRMRQRGRYASWSQIEERIRAACGPSTLIVVDRGIRFYSQAWWTTDDLVSAAPLHRIDEWCWHEYLADETGRAFLTELPDPIYETMIQFPGPVDPACCQAIYPSLNVIVTDHVPDRRVEAASHFFGILGKDLDASIPAIIAALSHQDPDVRDMCLVALRLAGPSAAEAIPQLTKQFLHGPSSEQWTTARTLMYLGPSGQDVVRRAMQSDDHRLRKSATEAFELGKPKV